MNTPAIATPRPLPPEVQAEVDRLFGEPAHSSEPVMLPDPLPVLSIQQMPEIALHSARLNRTLVLRRSQSMARVYVYLYVGRRQSGDQPIVLAMDPISGPSVCGLDIDGVTPWLDVCFNRYELDNLAEALAINLWLTGNAEQVAA